MQTYFGIVHPWDCDAMGHLNSAFYCRMFDDAGAGAMHHLGVDINEGVAENLGWADVRLELDYKDELRANAIVSVQSRIVSLGNTTITIEHTLRNESKGAVAAVATVKTACFDLEKRSSRPLPTVVRETAQKFID